MEYFLFVLLLNLTDIKRKKHRLKCRSLVLAEIWVLAEDRVLWFLPPMSMSWEGLYAS